MPATAEILVVALVIVLLVLLNGLFVAAEFAVLVAPRTALATKSAAGDAGAAAVLAVVGKPRSLDRYIATAQVGITMASLGLGMYGEHALAQWLAPRLEALGDLRWIGAHAAASTLAVVVLTYLHIVVGEMVPKAVALQHPQRTATAIARPMHAMKVTFFPIVVALNAAANGLLRMMGVRRQSTSRYLSPDELRLVVEESRGSGALRDQESRLLHESLEFSDLTARDVMVARVRVAALPLGTGSSAMEAIVRASPHTRYPVYRDDLDHLVGAVHVGDLLRAAVEGRPLVAEDLQSLPYIPESAPLDRVLETLRRRRAHMAVVMDEYGGTAGILTMEDLMEELVGEIEEGTQDRIVAPVERGVRVPGSLRLDELEDLLGRPVTHPHVDTVSGLVLDLLGRPPKVGDVATHDDIRFEVEEIHGRGVQTCRVERIEPPQRDAGT